MKKLISLVLVLVMVLGLFAACDKAPADDTKAPEQNNTEGTQAPETTEAPVELEPVVLKWIHDGAEKDGTKDVIEVFNKKLSEIIPNTSIEVTFVADYGTNWNMMLAGGEVMDVAWVGWKTPMLQDTLDGSFTPLNDLIEKYGPNIAKEREIWAAAYGSGALNGEQWMIPSVQPTVPEAQWFGYGSYIAPYFDADAMLAEIRSNAHMTEKMLDLLEEAIEAAIADGALVVGSDDWKLNIDYIIGMSRFGYKSFPGTDLIYAVEDTEFKNLYGQWETPEAKILLERIADWHDRGWITQNNLLGQTPEGCKSLFHFDGSWNANWGMASDKENGTYTNELSATSSDGQDIHYILFNKPLENVQEPISYGRENTYMVIPYTAENPERAMMVLNLLHDEVGTPGNDLYNLLCYGFEKNSPEAAEYGWYGYERIEKDGQDVRSDYTGEMHAMTNWIIGNTYKVLSDDTPMLTVESKENCMKFYEETYNNLPTNIASNEAIVFDGIADYRTAVKAVYTEYKTLLHGGSCGSANFESTYEEAVAKARTAGLDTQEQMVRDALANLK